MTDSSKTTTGVTTAPDDPIVSQVRAERDSIAAALNYDLDALFERVKTREDQERAAGRIILPNTDASGAAA